MPTNLEEKTTNKSIVSYSEDRAKQWINVINRFQVTTNQAPIDFAPILKESIENAKSFTGGDAATGQGLIETRVDSPITYLGNRGGIFIEAGVQYKPNSSFNVTFNGYTLNGSFQQIPCGTDTPNEISTFSTGTATLLRERAEIQGCEDVLARTPDRSQLIASFEQALEEEKLVLADQKSAAAVTGNASVAAINPADVSTQTPITDAMMAMTGNIGNLYSNPGTGHVYLMNQSGFSQFLREVDTQGNYVNSKGLTRSYFERSYNNGARPTAGLMGYFNGTPVFVTAGLLDTYTVDASGAITAQTGGTSTAVLYGLPYTLGLARGVAEYDTITVFDAQNDRDSYYKGEVTVGAATYMAAVLKNPAGWNYFAF